MKSALVTLSASMVNAATSVENAGISLSQANGSRRADRFRARRCRPGFAPSRPARVCRCVLPAASHRRLASASRRTATGATCTRASPGASPRARGWPRVPGPDRATDVPAGRDPLMRSLLRSGDRLPARMPPRCRATATPDCRARSRSASESGSIPRAKITSSSGSMPLPRSAFRISVFTANAGM